MIPAELWAKTLQSLEASLSAPHFNTWLKPLVLNEASSLDNLVLLAPNRFVRDWVQDKFLEQIIEQLREFSENIDLRISLKVAALQPVQAAQVKPKPQQPAPPVPAAPKKIMISPAASKPEPQIEGGIRHQSNLDAAFSFDAFVGGKSNQLAFAAAQQVAENQGSYNPLFIYGGVGLGKTHLMQAIGNQILHDNPSAKIIYVNSERFVIDMARAYQLKAMPDFKRHYRSADVLLIDDIQFLAGKTGSQEEFFHTFNSLLDGGQQIILTSDTYPKEIENLEDRLKSRFSWGLTVEIQPPDLETRTAILMRKAEQANIDLPSDAALFLADRFKSSVRELEGVLTRVRANASFTGHAIDIPFIKETLKDLLALQDKQVSISNIQRVVAEYYNIKLADLLSKRKTRSIARPRQMAMSLAKKLTNHSLPEIGNGFGGRDHTTVLHACKKIKALCETDTDIREDYNNLLRTLTA